MTHQGWPSWSYSAGVQEAWTSQEVPESCPVAGILTSTVGHPVQGKNMVCVCSWPDLKQGRLTHPKKNKRNQKTLLVKSIKGPQHHPEQKLQTGFPQAKFSLPTCLGFLAHTVFFFSPFLMCRQCYKR